MNKICGFTTDDILASQYASHFETRSLLVQSTEHEMNKPVKKISEMM